MANSKRLRVNRDNKIFIPMNIEGSGQENGFFTSSKLIAVIALLILTILTFSFLSTVKANAKGYTIAIITLLFIVQLVIRYVVFEEKYYYKVYKKTQQYKHTTPAAFWDVASFRDTEDGTIIVYSDMKMGVLVRIERDTIVGKGDSFVEEHFDAMSEFYKEVNIRNLRYVKLNLMEKADKDDRISHLDRVVSATDNENIAKVLEMKLGHIKNITRETLYESDYILFYTVRQDGADYILSDVSECLYKLMGGAYNRYEIMHSRDIKEMPKELYCVNYFDYADATMQLFKQSGFTIPKAFDIKEIKLSTGESIDVGEREKILINNLASCIEDGTIKRYDWSIKDALDGKLNINYKVNSDKESKTNTVGVAEYTEDNIIDLDNEAFGGGYGVGINTVMDKDNKD